jgi:membrane fusion protein (multidrug efflux system)
VNFQINEAVFISYQQNRQKQNGETEQPFDLKIRLPNNEVYSESGIIDFADTKSDATTGSVALRATFPNPNGIVLPGLYVKLLIESRQKASQVVVPQFAVQESQLGKFVLVVGADNTVVQRLVTLGRRLGPMWAVESGLDAGENVIVEGLQKVRPGAIVAPVFKKIDETTGALHALDAGV